MIKKGIILAGGKGTRVGPSTKAISKQLIPIADKPIIFYSLSVLMLLNIRDILIIVKPSDKLAFNELLGNGESFGIKIRYVVQKKPRGLPDAFILGKKFIGHDPVALILGDNFFHGQSLISLLNDASKNFNIGANIFSYNVKNPQDYGVIENFKNKIKIIEKPKTTKSKKAITGLYFFDKNVSKLSRKLEFSKRGELEIIDLLKFYLKLKKLTIRELGRGSAWLDTGTSRDILKASNYVEVLQDRQNQKIGCLEEIAFTKKWIDKNMLKTRIKFYGKNEYSKYLNDILNKLI
ncbi:sugar phosphate nucleotidyltransferase [Candidatus Pelagibacter ubique]|jgi:glucose-1-phosphate thymidylyltransferase|nr:sugar phosphate nucleotidyltransferase [Candidatus Pelagibacter ubique]